MLKTILIVDAEDADGFPILAMPQLVELLRATGADRWTGRAAAINEIDRGRVTDAEHLENSTDETIAAYLLMTRADSHPDLPDLSTCATIIE